MGLFQWLVRPIIGLYAQSSFCALVSLGRNDREAAFVPSLRNFFNVLCH